jgi:hypothetical protein
MEKVGALRRILDGSYEYAEADKTLRLTMPEAWRSDAHSGRSAEA